MVSLQAIGAVRSTVTKSDRATVEVRYFITILTDVKIFSKAVRGHWGIENSLHWCLDVIFNEDDSRTRKDYSAENLSLIRKIALNALKSITSKKSINMRR